MVFLFYEKKTLSEYPQKLSYKISNPNAFFQLFLIEGSPHDP